MKKPAFIGDCRGLTLIEIMIVVVILGILALAVIPNVIDRPDEARQIKAQSDIKSLETALRLFKLDNGFYPTTDQGLQALVVKPTTGKIPKKWNKPYLDKGKLPKDPWGNEFIYLSPGLHGDYDIICYGADGVPGGESFDKDINSWEIE